MNNITTFYIVRHGESEENAHPDPDSLPVNHWGEYQAPLTERGEKQAQKRAEELRNIHFDAAFSSDLTRAKQTAEIIALERKIAIQTTDMIRERSSNEYFKKIGKSKEEIFKEMQEDLKSLDEKGKLTYKHTPVMESVEEAASRMITFLREIAVAYPGKTILVTNHGNLMRSLLTHIGYVKYDELPSGTVENTGYIVMQCDGTDFFVKETHGIHKTEGRMRIF